MASYSGTTFVRTNGYQKLVLPYKINTEAERDVLFTTKIKITLQMHSEQPNTSCSFIFDVCSLVITTTPIILNYIKKFSLENNSFFFVVKNDILL